MVKNKVFIHAAAFVLAIFAVCVCSVVIVSAEDLPAENTEYTELVEETSISGNDGVPIVVFQNNSDNDGFDSSDIVSTEIVRSTNPVTPTEANGLKKIMLQLIGDYDMVTTEYTYTSSNGYTSKQVTTEPDYSWMITAALFIMVLWSLFRFVGGLACGRS